MVGLFLIFSSCGQKLDRCAPYRTKQTLSSSIFSRTTTTGLDDFEILAVQPLENIMDFEDVQRFIFYFIANKQNATIFG